MYRKQRQEEILALIRKQGYASVEMLTGHFHYSTATINRDLNELQKQNLIKRSYGGAEPVVPHGIPHVFRYRKMRKSKRKISARAAALVKDGDTIFIDGSTTAEYMAEFLFARKNLTVITNNCLLAADLYSYGVRAICLGGQIGEAPCVTWGDMTCRNAACFLADKLFFSTGAATSTGLIGGAPLLFSVMIEHARESWLLIDKEKIDKPCTECALDFSAVTGVISDFDFPEATKKKFPDTVFFCTEESGGNDKA